MKKVVFVFSVFLLLVASTLIATRTKAATQNTIQTAPVVKKTFTKAVQSSGKTKAKTAVELKFQTSGKLTWVGVKEGDTVQAWQALASLDTREVQKNLEKALREYSAERNDFEETWRVEYKGLANPQAALTDTVKRILEKNQWDLEKAVLDVELKHLAVEYSSLVTPIAGIVTHIDTPIAGVNITPATAAFEVIDPTSMIFVANIDETDVGALLVGQHATIALDAFPGQEFGGTISYISYQAVVSSGGATVFPVEIAIATAQTLRAGLNGDVRIDAQTIPNALIVPSEALREDDLGKYVYIESKDGKSYTKRKVETGITSDSETIITHGLKAGEKVVIKGFSAIPQKK